MQIKITLSGAISTLFGILVLAAGFSNLFLVHAVPGMGYIMLSLLYFPPVNTLLADWFGWKIPPVIKIILAFVIVWFTFGVSDLGDMMD